MQQQLPPIVSAADIKQCDGQPAVAVGTYRAVAPPVKGGKPDAARKDRAIVELEDGTRIFIEPLDSAQSLRKATELQRFDGKRVQVQGIVHAVMPARGAGVLAPCIALVTSIREGDQP